MSFEVRALTADDAGALGDFLAGLPAEDRTFFWSDVTDPAVAREWAGDERRIRRAAFADGGGIVAFTALVPGTDWSSHVAEIVLVVAPDARRGGVGKALARAMLIEAIQQGFSKVTVSIAADNAGAITMFQGIGFQAEALLRDHLLNPDDLEKRDLVLLAHLVDETFSTMAAGGLGDVS